MSTRATAKVLELHVDQNNVSIILDLPPENSPRENVFNLRTAAANYNAMYSLALAAAANRWPLTIKVEGKVDITPGLDAFVEYVAVNWDT